jgi:predicted nucleic acid-binding protein
MLVVVDFNVVFSALASGGVVSEVFALNMESGFFEFISPEAILEESAKNRGRLMHFSSLSDKEIDKALSFILSQIRIIPFSEFFCKMPEAIKLDRKDSPYIALALAKGCPIFTGDKRLSSLTSVQTLSPRQMLDMLKTDKASLE